MHPYIEHVVPLQDIELPNGDKDGALIFQRVDKDGQQYGKVSIVSGNDEGRQWHTTHFEFLADFQWLQDLKTVLKAKRGGKEHSIKGDPRSIASFIFSRTELAKHALEINWPSSFQAMFRGIFLYEYSADRYPVATKEQQLISYAERQLDLLLSDLRP